MQETNADQKDKASEPQARSLLAGWVIGPYLVIHTISLSLIALTAWLSSDWRLMAGWFPAPLPDEKFIPFQRALIAACASGLGGGVFMIRSFYLRFAYGREKSTQPIKFLQASEIPRYILLPLSSFVLGPIGLALLQIGAITFAGISSAGDVPLLTVVAVCFVLGFSYHDMLKALQNLSTKILGGSTPQKESEQK